MPLLRLDFDEKAHTVPASHWNVHGESGATSALLARSNVDHEGRLSKIHLPVGGVRYRPCLEDFIEMLICEFQFDTCDGWRHALYDGREQWRSFQTRAIVRDMPDAAADVLRRIGYGVAAPAIPPQRNRDMLRAR